MNSFRAAVLLLTILAGSIVIWAQDNDDFIKVDSTIVVLNASVTDAGGKAVHGLSQKQFKVFEDGVEQTLASFDAEDTPFAAAILLDASGSMEERIAMARSAAIEFLGGLRSDDFTAVYKFDSRVELLQDFTNSHDLRDRIFDVKADGMTTLNDAVYKAAVELSKRSEKRRAIIVLSDGADTFSKKSADKALRAAQLANATIYTVDMSVPDTTGLSREQNQGVLKGFADKTGGKYVATPGGAAMRDAFARIVAELGTQYTITYEPANAKKDGKWRSIELRISKPGLTIRTRKGYYAPKT
jgi:Ca-activated chloride channel family protein